MSKSTILKATRSMESLRAVCEVLCERTARTGHEMLVAALTMVPVPNLITRAAFYAQVNEIAVFTAHASGKRPEGEDIGATWDAQKWLHRSTAERLGLNVTKTDGSLIEPELVPMNAMGGNGKPKMRMVSFKTATRAATVMAEYSDRIRVHNAR